MIFVLPFVYLSAALACPTFGAQFKSPFILTVDEGVWICYIVQNSIMIVGFIIYGIQIYKLAFVKRYRMGGEL